MSPQRHAGVERAPCRLCFHLPTTRPSCRAIPPGPRYHCLSSPLEDGQFSVAGIPRATSSSSCRSGSQKTCRRRARASQCHQQAHHPRRIPGGGTWRRDQFWNNNPGTALIPAHGGSQRPPETTWVSLQVPDGTDWLSPLLNAPTKSLPLEAVREHGTTSRSGSHPQRRMWSPRWPAITATAPTCSPPALANGELDGPTSSTPTRPAIRTPRPAPVQEPCCSPFTGKHPTADDAE